MIILKNSVLNLSRFVLLLSALSLVHCSTTPKVNEFPESASANDEVERFAADVSAAEKDQIRILAPSAFEEANKSLRKAQENQSEGKDPKQSLHAVAEGRAHLEHSRNLAEEARKKMGDVVAARKDAMAAGAETAVENEFKSLDLRLEGTTSKLEKNDTSGLKEQRQKLTAEYKAVELQATKINFENEKQKSAKDEGLLNAERKSAQALANESAGMKAEQELNKSLEAARTEFTKEDAEVYRQGNQLVIRLRSLEFPANESVIRGSNFPLLAKVAKVVNGFENSTVVIEGHTDSVGGKELNQSLSAARADAVASYLVSNQAVDKGHVSTVGYGFERPLASNKSSKGRAQNRRVDVIINPQASVRR